MNFDEFIEVKSPKHGVFKVLVDKEDVGKVSSMKLYIGKVGKYFYARINPSKISLHRFMMNPPKGMVIDHINRNTLDNRKENLRICTIQQNLQNQKRENNKTGTTGVAVFPGGRFTAQIKVNYKKIHLGLFNFLEDAIRARKEAEKRYFL